MQNIYKGENIMNGECLVSVIIPTYNRADTIERAINSVLAQSYNNIEIIIVDDASTDSTFRIIQTFKDSKIKYIRNEKNLGPAISRNRGVFVAKGEIIAFQDSDDEWLSNKLEIQIEKMKNIPEFAMVYCPYLYFGKKTIRQVPDENIPICELEGNIYSSLLKCNKIGTPTILVKKEIFEIVGGFDENMYAYEDWDFAIKVSRDYKIGYIPTALVNAYYSDNGVNSNDYNLANGISVILKKNFNQVSDKNITKGLIQSILERSIKSRVNCKELLVPEIINSNLDYELLMDMCEKTIIWKNKYEVFSWLEDCATTYFQSESRSFVIYGAGILSQKLIKILQNINKEIQYIIDKREKKQTDIKLISLSDFSQMQGNGICVITVYDADKTIEKMLKKNFIGQIINLFELAQK